MVHVVQKCGTPSLDVSTTFLCFICSTVCVILDCGLSSYELDEEPGNSGVLVYEFDRNTGELIFESGAMKSTKSKHWEPVVDSLQESSVIVLLTR